LSIASFIGVGSTPPVNNATHRSYRDVAIEQMIATVEEFFAIVLPLSLGLPQREWVIIRSARRSFALLLDDVVVLPVRFVPSGPLALTTWCRSADAHG
jgi:hypothetical protein